MGNIAPIAFVIYHQGLLKLFKTECANYFETKISGQVISDIFLIRTRKVDAQMYTLCIRLTMKKILSMV